MVSDGATSNTELLVFTEGIAFLDGRYRESPDAPWHARIGVNGQTKSFIKAWLHGQYSGGDYGRQVGVGHPSQRTDHVFQVRFFDFGEKGIGKPTFATGQD